MKEARGVAILYSVTTYLSMGAMTMDTTVADVLATDVGAMGVVTMDVRDTL